MKHIHSLITGALSLTLLIAANASAANILAGSSGPFPGRKLAVREEIALDSLFAPYQGFDDNDQVVVVVHGTLPNACFSLADGNAELQGDGKTIEVHQYAIRRIDGICAEGSDLPPHLQMTVPFTQEIQVGRLSSSNYGIQFLSSETGKTEIRKLFIDRAAATTIDSMPYAVISNASISDVVLTSQEAVVTLSGVLNSSCISLNPEVKIERDRDVIVLLPTVTFNSDQICTQMLVPFEHKVSLGKIPAGQYLIHVRSMNGQSVSRVIHSVATYR